MTQQSLFFEPEKLKKGKDKCPTCHRLMRSYAKTLDLRLIKIFYEIAEVARQHDNYFNPRRVFMDDHHKVTDFQKLHYWGFIEKTKKSGLWKMKQKGWQFLKGNIQVPKRVWVFNNQVVSEDDDLMVHVGNIDDRWQQGRSDWAYDFVVKTQV